VGSSVPQFRCILFLVWRDTSHPDGGGSEVYIEHMARWLVRQGHDVTIACAEHDNAPRDEFRDGIRFRRRGRWLTVYPQGLSYLLTRKGRRTDIVVDVQNGVPFCTPLVRRRNSHLLIHHVHREQWQIIYPGRLGRLGWWVESRLSPWMYRNTPYITVSPSTRRELAELGVSEDRVAVVCSGIDVPHPSRVLPRSATPRICVLGRLVPHKQVEHALHVAAALRELVPDLHLDIVGDGWWADHLRSSAQSLGVADLVTFHGYVTEADRDAVLDASWLMLMPSIKEGWGISIMEAAARGVPAVAYASAGGVTDAIVHGETGVLVDNLDGLVQQTEQLLNDTEARLALGKKARDRANNFDWAQSGLAFEQLLLGNDSQRLP
jgi:glycosyltransferase involved in cell wall biosynthesis